MVITSKSNPVIKDIAKLSQKKYRREYGLYIVEGAKSVGECIAAGCRISKIIATCGFADKYPEAIVVSEEVFACISDEKSPQGVLATVKMPEQTLKPPVGNCVLLDGLQDCGNVGTIIRTANAAGFGDIYLIDCADRFAPKTVRASMSGIFFARTYSGSRSEILRALEGTPIICADMGGEDIFSFVPPDKFCLCIGNEGNGISEEVFKRAKYRVKIPMDGSCESLNAAVSAGIAMYALKNAQIKR